MKRTVAVALTALALTCAAPSQGFSAGAPPAAAGAGAGAWVAGAGFVVALSAIICASVIGKRENREMTKQEAALAILLPFSCLYANPNR
jgi:hypothetical protein